MTRSTLVTPILLLAVLTGGAGCANLERNLQDPAVWQRVAEINDRYADRRREIETGDYGQAQFIDLTGDWTFRHGGALNTNRIRHGAASIMVMPIGRSGASAHCREVRLNLYRCANGATYEFQSIHTGTWRSNDKRNLVIHLRRATWQ